MKKYVLAALAIALAGCTHTNVITTNISPTAIAAKRSSAKTAVRIKMKMRPAAVVVGKINKSRKSLTYNARKNLFDFLMISLA